MVASHLQNTSALMILYSLQIMNTISCVRMDCGTIAWKLMGPFSLRLNPMSGGDSFMRMPKPCSSFSMISLCVRGFSASSTIRMTLQVSEAASTCRPRPLPSFAPSMIPGRSRIWILAPRKCNVPGMAVRVVNSYPAARENVPVNFVSSVDLPTEGNPIKPTRVSPDLLTSKPRSPAPPPFFGALESSSSSLFSFESFAFSMPK
mmetsp:Transcript_16918/g.37597  ORF Transcript_16918/g.37597 Transcript_16918/m.37597 type:complete len:204 (+) Transcript_16918:545-1156(+)